MRIILLCLVMTMLIGCSDSVSGPSTPKTITFIVEEKDNDTFIFSADPKSEWTAGSDLEAFLEALSKFVKDNPDRQIRSCLHCEERRSKAMNGFDASEKMCKLTQEGSVAQWTERLAVFADKIGLPKQHINWNACPHNVAHNIYDAAKMRGKLDSLAKLLGE